MAQGTDQPASNSTEPLSEAVGERVRAFREMRALSQRTLAQQAGVSASFVSQLENGHTSASVGSLRRITAALGVTLADLFDPSLQHPRALLRARDRLQLPMDPGARKYVISQAPIQNVEIYAAEFEPGASTGDEQYIHGDSQEFLLIVRGEMTLLLGSEKHVMATGDSIEYRTSIEHGLRNHSSRPAEVLWVTSPPTPDEVPVSAGSSGRGPTDATGLSNHP